MAAHPDIVPPDVSPASAGWTLLMPIRAASEAKTRLAGATATPAGHLRLVLAIRQDTVRAASGAGGVRRIVIVTDDAATADALDLGSSVELLRFVQSGPGLNQGLSEAHAWAAQRWPTDGVVALVADLPSLLAADLTAALEQAAKLDRSFVADACATGTTMLAVRPGTDLDPRFGPGSAAAHARLAAPLDVGPSLRLDVDTEQDLLAAIAYGVGPRTAGVFAIPDRLAEPDPA